MYNIPMAELKYLGRKIQARRKALGLTQEQLAEKLNCSLTHLCRIEGGCKPGLDALLRLCRVLGCSLDELLGLYPPENQTAQRILSCVQSRSEREQRAALLALQHLFETLDRLKDPNDSLWEESPDSTVLLSEESGIPVEAVMPDDLEVFIPESADSQNDAGCCLPVESME